MCEGLRAFGIAVVSNDAGVTVEEQVGKCMPHPAEPDDADIRRFRVLRNLIGCGRNVAHIAPGIPV